MVTLTDLLEVGGAWGGYEFPAEFQFGAASSAFQIEGAWNVSDKTASVWDNWLHRAGSEFNGDVTCNSYNQWQEDVEAAAALGLDFYRFSLSWSRLLPSGLSNEVSEDGVRYYNQLIDGLLARGIEPVVTIYHWDLPQNLQDLGGWANPLIGEWFANYARVAYSKFGDRVRRWLTINEPFSFCVVGYDYAMHPPGMSWAGVADYICIKNVLVAHARAWRVYDEEFRTKYHDKTASVWDNWLHRAGSEFNGDVTCNSYNQWQEDVEAAAALGLDFYRFSLSWSRLLPSGLSNEVSEDGVRYYNQLIDGLLARGIEPVVTIYHWDLPQNLQDLGGWANPLIGEWFANYARVAYSKFGDRVRRWLTINEPFSFCVVGYDYAMHPPGMSWAGVADYICIKNVLVAHARAWRVYDEEFRTKYHGKVALCNQMVWIEADEDDDGTAELLRQIYVGLFNHPIFSKKGGWPPVIEQIIEKNSKVQGYPRSRLPSFTKEEIKLVRGTFDFLAMNHYTSRVGRRAREGESALTYVLGAAEVDGVFYPSPEWGKAGTSWFYIYYEGMRKQLKWLKDNYGDVEILITENGYGDSDGLKIQDDERITYISEMLKQVLLAMHEDGVRVVGYTAWSLLDNLEWHDGFASRFGLYQVDFDDAALARVPRASARYYAGVITSRSAEYTNTTSS